METCHQLILQPHFEGGKQQLTAEHVDKTTPAVDCSFTNYFLSVKLFIAMNQLLYAVMQAEALHVEELKYLSHTLLITYWIILKKLVNWTRYLHTQPKSDY